MESGQSVKQMKNLPAQLALDHVSPATLLLERRRQMQEVQQALDAQKEEYARKEEAFRRREDSLRKKDLELQESLVQFNKFLKDKYDKRAKYDRLAQEERKQRQLKEKEIRARQIHLRKINEECRELKKQVLNHEQYQAFLTRVQEENLSEWPEVGSVLSRSQSLDFAYKDLLERQRAAMIQNETLRNEFANYSKEQITKSLNLNNRIAQLQSELERAESHSFTRQSEEDQKRLSQAERSREVSVIIMSVDNLLQRCMHQATALNHSEPLKHDLGPSADEAADSMTDDELASLKTLHATSLRLDIIGNYLADFLSIGEEQTPAVKGRTRAANH